MFLSLEIKAINIFKKNLTKISKIGEILVENWRKFRKMWKKSTEFTLFSQKFTPR